MEEQHPVSEFTENALQNTRDLIYMREYEDDDQVDEPLRVLFSDLDEETRIDELGELAYRDKKFFNELFIFFYTRVMTDHITDMVKDLMFQGKFTNPAELFSSAEFKEEMETFVITMTSAALIKDEFPITADTLEDWSRWTEEVFSDN